jgi:exosortase/archaeosortase family protein
MAHRRHLRRLRRMRRQVLSLMLAASGVALLVFARDVRVFEAYVQHTLLGWAGVNTEHVQTALLFLIQGHRFGISLTPGCSIGPLLGVFLIAASPFAYFRDLPVRRVVVSAIELMAVFVISNQVRFAVIIGAMKHWGFERGYEATHVFLGSAITTVGFVIGATLFIRLLASRPSAAPA